MMDTLKKNIIKKGGAKIKPTCPVFGECGGCAYQDMAYELELKLKEGMIKEGIVEKLGIKESTFHPIVSSPSALYYRQRIDLRLQRTRNGVFIGYTPKQGRGILPIERCPIALESINAEIPQIKKEAVEKLPPKYRRANLTVRSGDDGRVFWGGIGRRSLKMEEADYLWTQINGRRIFYAMETFFQANLSILPKLINTLRSLEMMNKQTRLFDLYGGVGLFSVNLHDIVKDVTLVEEAAASIRLAQFNQSYHGIKNLKIIEGRLEECFEAVSDDGLLHGVAIIDPPRCGLSAASRSFLSQARVGHLVYLSCNPDALTEDLREFMNNGWEVTSVTPFDFFPRTKHIETLVVLENTHGKK